METTIVYWDYNSILGVGFREPGTRDLLNSELVKSYCKSLAIVARRETAPLKGDPYCRALINKASPFQGLA